MKEPIFLLDDSGMSRRRFLGSSLLSAAGLSLLPGLLSASVAPSDQVRIGVIGLGRRAIGLTKNFLRIPGVQVVAGSDVYGVKRQRFAQLVNEYYAPQKKKQQAKTYENYRDLLSRKDIDAVVIASPDHWGGTPNPKPLSRTRRRASTCTGLTARATPWPEVRRAAQVQIRVFGRGLAEERDN